MFQVQERIANKLSITIKLFLIVILNLLGLSFAKAQIRIEGQFKLGRANQTQIEAAIEDAIKYGRIRSNGFRWEHMRQEMNEQKLRKVDSLTFTSLRENGYFYDRTNTKNYLIYIDEITTFYIVRVVNCQSVPSEHNGMSCALGIITILSEAKLKPTNSMNYLSRKQKKYFVSKLYEYMICGKKVMI